MSKMPANARRLMGGPTIRTRPAMTLCQRLRPGLGLGMGTSGGGSGPTPPPVETNHIIWSNGATFSTSSGSQITYA